MQTMVAGHGAASRLLACIGGADGSGRPSKWPRCMTCMHEERMEPSSMQVGCRLGDNVKFGFGPSGLAPKNENKNK